MDTPEGQHPLAGLLDDLLQEARGHEAPPAAAAVGEEALLHAAVPNAEPSCGWAPAWRHTPALDFSVPSAASKLQS